MLAYILPTQRKETWAASIDLKDAHLHIPIHDSCLRFLAFSYRTKDYIFRAPTLGLMTTPRVFMRAVSVTVAYLWTLRVPIFTYLDDWLIESKRPAERNMSLTLDTLALSVYLRKSSLDLSRQVPFLGVILDPREA